MNTNDKQIAANRQNAKRSTGPKSPAGKLAVAKNGIEHGIYALNPVIEGVEPAREWKRYRHVMLTSLAPVGMLETTPQRCTDTRYTRASKRSIRPP